MAKFFQKVPKTVTAEQWRKGLHVDGVRLFDEQRHAVIRNTRGQLLAISEGDWIVKEGGETFVFTDEAFKVAFAEQYSEDPHLWTQDVVDLLGKARMELRALEDESAGCHGRSEFRDRLFDAEQRLALGYCSSQATTCAGCGLFKHTPLRVDSLNGYVCLICISKALEERQNKTTPGATMPSDSLSLEAALFLNELFHVFTGEDGSIQGLARKVADSSHMTDMSLVYAREMADALLALGVIKRSKDETGFVRVVDPAFDEFKKALDATYKEEQ